MAKKKIEVVRGSGNVFRDLGLPNPDVLQLKAILAANIIGQLDKAGLSVRAAHARTGIAAADFSRIRSTDLSRFTVDRLMMIVNKLGSQIDVKVKLSKAA
jgi:predicted XRE-type DNA-binding protein